MVVGSGVAVEARVARVAELKGVATTAVALYLRRVSERRGGGGKDVRGALGGSESDLVD